MPPCRRLLELGSLLNHSNIVQELDVGQFQDTYFMAMEHSEGLSPRELLKSHRPLPPTVVAYIGAELGEALDYVHRRTSRVGLPLNLVHRDVNPPNILLSRIGEVKQGDFGVARAAIHVRLTQADRVRGKLGYLAPEQARGEPFDGRANLFALGLALHETLTGRRVFSNEALSVTVCSTPLNQPNHEPGRLIMRKENRLRTIIAPYSVLFFLYSAQAGAEPTVRSGGLSLKRLSVETPAGAEGDIAFASEAPQGNANAGISVTRPPFSASLLFNVTGDRFNGGDSLTAAEPDDFWFFSVPADRTILFEMSSSNPDYIVELYEIDWTTATAYPTSVGGYAGTPVANNGLPAGDWALRVYSAGALGNTYTIKLNAANPRGASSIRSLSSSYLQAVLGYPTGDIYANGSYVVTVGGTNAHLDWKREFYFPWDGNYESRTHSIYSAKVLNVSAPVSYTSSYASSTNAILIYLAEGTGFMHHQSSFRSGPPVQYYSSFVDTIGKTTPRSLDSDDLTNWGDQILIYDLNTGKPIDFFSVLNFYYASGVEALPTMTWLN